MTVQKLIDSIESDIQRMRIDEALKVSLVHRLDELRRSVAQCHVDPIRAALRARQNGRDFHEER
ncbi:MAG: hypothetical protein CPSOU_1802 [uncultured Paraburkholderia sp.]|nr:MAG: hypothetical protein CPSOU_1802 [uncultured Paraburkholderia sp.]